MVFTDLLFIFCFLPISVLLNSLIRNKKINNIILVLLSLLFYAWGNPASLVLLILSMLWNYFTGLELNAEQDDKKRKNILIFAVIVNLILLGVYKYTGFVLSILHIDTTVKIALPVGLSFFSFSELSYLFDVYKNKSEVQKSFILFSLYVSFFGKISMGPIVTYHDMEEQLSKRQVSKSLYS